MFGSITTVFANMLSMYCLLLTSAFCENPVKQQYSILNILLQVVPGIDKKKASAESVSLVEVGPRVCLNPIKIFGGSFGGPVLFDNPHFVSPNRVSIPLWCCVFHNTMPALTVHPLAICLHNTAAGCTLPDQLLVLANQASCNNKIV